MLSFIQKIKSFYLIEIFVSLTVILIFPCNIFAQSPYEMKWKKDGPLLLVGIPLALGGYALDASMTPLTIKEINDLDRGNIPQIDRFASYNYSESASNLSDILIYTCLTSPFLLLFSSAIRNDFSVVYGMYGESLLFGISLPFYGKAGIQRIRPYAYNSEVPLDKKLIPDTKKSFFSGHTSGAFTSVVFLSTIYGSYYPDSKWKPYIWTGSILIASTVGYLRIAAGSHFLTDVVVGAIVGATAGYIIPKIHETNHNNAIYDSPDVSNRLPALSFKFSL